MLFHLAPHAGEYAFAGWAALAALLALAFPGSTALFAHLLIAFCFYALARLPGGSNHMLLALLVSLAILAAGLRGGDRAAWFERFAPVVRLCLLAFYGCAFLHKLNTGFLDPDVSCAAEFYARTAEILPLLPVAPWALHVAGYAVVAAEGLIVAALLAPDMRRYAVLFALGFHYLVALTSFHAFSALLFALFLLFDIERFSAGLAELGRWKPSRAIRLVAVAAVAAVWVAGLPLSAVRGPLWHVYGLALIALLLWIGPWRPGRALVFTTFRPRPAWLAAFPLLVAFNGLNPYLGLKTENAFAMYSNLRTEGGRTNHVLIPARLQVADFQRDVVRILPGSDAFPSGRALLFYEFRTEIAERAARGERNIGVHFWRNGGSRRVANAESDPVLGRPYPYLVRKLLLFRPLVGPDRCRH